MVERLAHSFSLYREYEVLLYDSGRFRAALGAVYYDVLMFLKRTKQVFMSKGFRASVLPPMLRSKAKSERIEITLQKSLAHFRVGL